MMVDFSLSCASLSIDQGRNTKAYGAGITTEALLHGDVPLPECCGALARRLTEAEGRVVASAFEPSTRSESYW
jgi:lipid-binding SYLF domain-containing protein